MPTINLPNNWKPRPSQMAAWKYMERGGKHLELIAHRRFGKDELALHTTAVKAFERVGTYWHMLPQAAQARKAIWDAVNPHTGKRRIDEAFPHAIRSTTKDQEMMIKFINGSTWQVLGSDNFNSLVGSPPAGCVYSEWALANPTARAYLRPIFAENNGWQMFITTPRGKNHAYKTFMAAQDNPLAFAQKLSVIETGALSAEQLEIEKREYITSYGLDQGMALFEQEYLCSFDAALLGAYYGKEFRDIDAESRITAVGFNPEYTVHTAWDLGYSDDTAIWWYQVIGGEPHILEYYGASGLDPDVYFDIIKSKAIDKGYRYGTHWFPHDARAKTFASRGRSVQEMAWKSLGEKHVRIVPNLSLQDGIQAARLLLQKCWFDGQYCELGIEALRNYQREWDDDKKMFKPQPLHNWASHGSDAFRYMAIAWRDEYKPVDRDAGKSIHERIVAASKLIKEPLKGPLDRTIDEIIAERTRKRLKEHE